MKLNTILFITSFVPVMTFKTIARIGDATWMQAKIATVLGLALAIAQLLVSRRIHKHATYLEWAFLGFLACGTAWVYLMPESIASLFVKHSTTLLYFVLFLTTLIPQLIGFDPFTYAIAKQWAPEATWQTPQFRTINLHITYVFSVIMLLACLSSFIGQGKPVYAVIVPFLLIVGIGIPFSRLYPSYYIKQQFQAAPRSLADLPESARELILKMPVQFNPEAAGNMRADIQFKLSGDDGGHYVLSIAHGECVAMEGSLLSPALTIISPADVWVKLAKGEINRGKALMDGLYRVEGDMGLLMKLGELFSPSGQSKPPNR